MRVDKTGICRIVFVFKRFAIKIPRTIYGQRFFIIGMLSNQYERNQYKTQKSFKLGKVYFCGFLGLFLIMKRYKLLDRKLRRQEIKDLRIKGFDNHVGNIGLDENGNIILIDYGNSGFYMY